MSPSNLVSESIEQSVPVTSTFMKAQRPESTLETYELTPKVGKGPSSGDTTTCTPTRKRTHNIDLESNQVPVAYETGGSGTKSNTKREFILQDLSQNLIPQKLPRPRQNTSSQAATIASAAGKRPRPSPSSGSDEDEDDEGGDENRPSRSDRGVNNKRRRLSTSYIPVPALSIPPSAGVLDPFTSISFASQSPSYHVQRPSPTTRSNNSLPTLCPHCPPRSSATEFDDWIRHSDAHVDPVTSVRNANISNTNPGPNSTHTRATTSWPEESRPSLASDRHSPISRQDEHRESTASGRHSTSSWAEEFMKYIASDKHSPTHGGASTGSDDIRAAAVSWAEEFMDFIRSENRPPSHRGSFVGSDDSPEFDSDCLLSRTRDVSSTDSEWTSSRSPSPCSSLSSVHQFEPYNPLYSYPEEFEYRYRSDDDSRDSTSSELRESDDEEVGEDTKSFTTDCRDVEDRDSDSGSDDRPDDAEHSSSYEQQDESGSSGREGTADEETRYAHLPTSTPVSLSRYLRSRYRVPDLPRHDDRPLRRHNDTDLVYPNHWRLNVDPRDSFWQAVFALGESRVGADQDASILVGYAHNQQQLTV